MKLSTLVAELAQRTELSKRQVRTVLDALAEVTVESLVQQDAIKLPGLGTLLATWRAPRKIRSVRTARKVDVPGAWVPKFRPTSALRRALATDNDPAMSQADQHATTVARTLVSDLALYGGGPPRGVRHDMDLTEVKRRCVAHYGNLWDDAVDSFGQRIPHVVRQNRDYLGLAARAEFSTT